MNSSTRRESVESASRGTAQGRVTAVRGSVVDIRFDKHLPPIYSLLRAGVVFSLFAALIVSLFTLKYLPRLPFGRQLILDTELPTDEGFVSAPQSDLT